MTRPLCPVHIRRRAPPPRPRSVARGAHSGRKEDAAEPEAARARIGKLLRSIVLKDAELGALKKERACGPTPGLRLS